MSGQADTNLKKNYLPVFEEYIRDCEEKSVNK